MMIVFIPFIPAVKDSLPDIGSHIKQTNSVASSPQANYTD
jgi:hypothetical protein